MRNVQACEKGPLRKIDLEIRVFNSRKNSKEKYQEIVNITPTKAK